MAFIPTTTLYKFTRREFVNKASFRLGTLYDYRNMETHGPHIGDSHEGSYAGNPWPDIPPEKAKFSPRFMARQPFEWVFFKGNDTSEKKPYLSLTSQDLLVYSLTRTFDPRHFDKFDADVCLEVHNYPEFFGALCEKLLHSVGTVCHSPCIYAAKEKITFKKPFPALPFWKHPLYESQAEYRLCVSVRVDPVSAVLINAPRALTFCTARNKSDYI